VLFCQALSSQRYVLPTNVKQGIRFLVDDKTKVSTRVCRNCSPNSICSSPFKFFVNLGSHFHNSDDNCSSNLLKFCYLFYTILHCILITSNDVAFSLHFLCFRQAAWEKIRLSRSSRFREASIQCKIITGSERKTERKKEKCSVRYNRYSKLIYINKCLIWPAKRPSKTQLQFHT
jgi:hypothetical protein